MASITSVGVVWSDIDCELIQNSQGNLKIVENIAAVVSSIDCILRTSPGERVMRPDFGSSLKNIIFENTNATLMNFLSRQIKEVIERWEDRVSVTEVQFFAEPDENQISITILFAVKGHPQIFRYERSIKGEA